MKFYLEFSKERMLYRTDKSQYIWMRKSGKSMGTFIIEYLAPITLRKSTNENNI